MTPSGAAVPRRLALVLVIVSLLPSLHAASADSAGALPAPPVRLDEVVPTVMEATATLPVDLDSDGGDDFVVVSRDGVAQRYTADGELLWSTSYVEVADAMGVVPFRQNDQFWADFEGISSCGSSRSVAFHDADGDGTHDVFALLWLRTLAPQVGMRTVVVVLDGASGAVIRAEPLAGRALAHAVADLDGDGRAEHVVVEEDGPPVTWSSSEEAMVEGSGLTATVRAADAVTGEALWTFDTGVTWPVTSGLVAVPRAGGHDVAVSLGGSNAGPRCTGSDIGAQPQRIVALAGATGAPRWEAAVDGLAQDLIGLPDGGIVTWTDDRGGVIEVLEGVDGSRRWRVEDLDGGGVLGAVSGAGDRLAALSARPVANKEDESRLVLLDAATGATVTDARLDGGQEPATSSELPAGDELRLVETGLDGAGDPVVLARTHRSVSAVGADGSLPWQEPSEGTARHVLFLTGGTDGPLVWTQGVFETSSSGIEGLVNVGSRLYTGLYRLTGRSALTGEATDTLPLLANVLGATRADVSGDGVPDRIFGGLGQSLMATDGATGDVRWQTDLGREIVDVWPEDLDADGVPDLLVEAHQEAMGVRGHDGAVLWRYSLEFPVLDGFAAGSDGAWRAAEVADMTGDGVRDLVLGFRTARDEAWAPAGNAKVIVLDGRTGAERWRTELPPFVKGVNALAIGDVTGDGVPDVAATLDAVGDSIYYGVVLLDGNGGSEVWAVHDFASGSRDTWGRDSVQLIDHGGDGDLDVAVLTRQLGSLFQQLRHPADVRVHDGGSGAFVSSTRVAPPDVELGRVTALHAADFGPAGLLLVAYGEYHAQGVRHVLAHAYDAEDLRTRFAIGIPTDGAAWDLATGDLTGDGVADLVVPTGEGLFVADGAAALDGEVVLLARTDPHRPLKGVLVDADGDGAAELETLETPAGWPLQIGPAFINQTAGPVRSLGLLDLSP